MSRWFAWAVLAGCSDAPAESEAIETDPCSTGEIGVEVGTGAEAYEPLSDGDEVILHHGIQGGWHIEVASAVSHIGPEIALHPRVTVPELDDREIVGSQQDSFVALVGYDADRCDGSIYGVRGFLDVADIGDVCTLDGRTLELSVTVCDILDERCTTSTVLATARLDERDAVTCAEM